MEFQIGKRNRWKELTLVLAVFLAGASAGGYGLLSDIVTNGERQVLDGQQQVDEGHPALDQGKAELEAGKAQLAEGKAKYEKQHDNLFLVLVDQIFNGGKAFEDGRGKIAAGDKQVAQGEAQITAGEKTLAAGELELDKGKQQLNLAKGTLLALAVGAVGFLVIAFGLALAILWRKPWAFGFLKKRR